LDIPLIAVDTLEILARQLQVSEGYIVPMIDARRMEVYSAIFDAKYQKLRETQAEIITEDSFATLEGEVYFVGDSTEKCVTTLTQPNFIFKDHIVYPSANEMSYLSNEKYKKNDTVDVAYFEPYYLKDFMTTAPKK
jgi:tRNA threonylcarbamoyladenosine biosynthesis protein TsaB